LSKLILATEVYSVVNAALEVLKKLGHGFHEKPYENALVVELSSRGMYFPQKNGHGNLVNCYGLWSDQNAALRSRS